MICITEKTRFEDLDEGERVVNATNVCAHCLEPIFFGTLVRQPKKYDQYHQQPRGLYWFHTNTGATQCAPTRAEPIMPP